jgi:ankyrin repeat protein
MDTFKVTKVEVAEADKAMCELFEDDFVIEPERLVRDILSLIAKIPKNVSATAWLDEKIMLDERGNITALSLAAKMGLLDKIPGGAAAEQLSHRLDVPKSIIQDPISPLHYAAIYGHLDQVMGGATWQQLAAVKALRSGASALHCAASYEHLDQIRGGVSAKNLQDARDRKGASALEEAKRFYKSEALTLILATE